MEQFGFGQVSFFDPTYDSILRYYYSIINDLIIVRFVHVTQYFTIIMRILILILILIRFRFFGQFIESYNGKPVLVTRSGSIFAGTATTTAGTTDEQGATESAAGEYEMPYLEVRLAAI